MNEVEARNRAKQLNRSEPHGTVYVADSDGSAWFVRTRDGKVIEK